jgi:hypothetical protein
MICPAGTFKWQAVADGALMQHHAARREHAAAQEHTCCYQSHVAHLHAGGEAVPACGDGGRALPGRRRKLKTGHLLL